MTINLKFYLEGNIDFSKFYLTPYVYWNKYWSIKIPSVFRLIPYALLLEYYISLFYILDSLYYVLANVVFSVVGSSILAVSMISAVDLKYCIVNVRLTVNLIIAIQEIIETEKQFYLLFIFQLILCFCEVFLNSFLLLSRENSECVFDAEKSFIFRDH